MFEAADGAAFGQFGLLMWSEQITDEFTYSGFTDQGFYNPYVDARQTVGGAPPNYEIADASWGMLMQAHVSLLLAIPGLVKYEPPSARSNVGQAFALAAYTELLVAEAYCGGTPLNGVLAGGGIEFGMPLSTDSLLGVAVTHFDSALAEANGSDSVTELARIGLGRALLDRNRPAAAAAAVASVPTHFIYNVELQPGNSGPPGAFSLYDNGYYAGQRDFNVIDREGGNGLNFLSAQDPRLTFDSSLTTTDGGTWYLPMKFEANFAYIPLATGIEARLIEAEAALRANQAPTWAAHLRALRADTVDTHVVFPQADSLPADSAEGAPPVSQVDLQFRERAFWLFGTGSRLGDLRRLIRQYGRDQSTVFPTGPYTNANNPHLFAPLPSYGTDVNLTLPTRAGGQPITNPNYKGCITSTKVA
jgi:hypothetical protein